MTNRRRSIRLRDYDYTQAGAYFVTIVTHHREQLFDDPILHAVAETFWQRIPGHFPHVELDEWVVMPNHVHGILVLTEKHRGRGEALPGITSIDDALASGGTGLANQSVASNASPLQGADGPRGAPPGSLGAIVGTFKSVTARRINRIRKTPGATVWQRNYYERIIRNQRELNAIRRYIRDNPANWAKDTENPYR